jgi:hypothetical protein
MIDWSKLPDNTWLQVAEFCLGAHGKNPNAPVRYGRVSWYQFVKDGHAPQGRKQGTQTLWQWGDIKEWIEATSPKSEAVILKEVDPNDILNSLTPFEVTMRMIHHPDVENIIITKAPKGGLTATINRVKGKPLKQWLNRKPPKL